MKATIDQTAVTRYLPKGAGPVMSALERCVNVALRDTGQSRIVAKAILSAYNGIRFQFGVSDLACVDKEIFDDLIQIFRLRHVGWEPHTFIENGGEIFERIARDWNFEGK